MLKKEDNELLTRTDAGTPMGEIFRQYWIPVAKSEEIEPDGEPLPMRLLGEDLVLFRDTEGEVGLIDEKCPHRGTSMVLGLNEGCGLTCIYHGWKFNVRGECVDLPSEPEDSGFIKGIKVKAYPIVETKGIIWTYMGDQENLPPFPHFYWMELPDSHLVSERVWQECNYLQAMENDLDYVHAAFLHKAYHDVNMDEGILSTDLGINPSHPLVRNPPVRQEVQSTNYGKRCLAVGETEDETKQAFMEIHYIFPFYTYPPRMAGDDGMWHAFIPRDDHSLWSWDVQFSHHRPIDAEQQYKRRGLNLDRQKRKLVGREENYGQDRELMKNANLSGIRGIANQDHAITEAMGTIVDRSIEHLGTSDVPIIQMRRMLLGEVKKWIEKQGQTDVPRVDNEILKKLYSCGQYASKGSSFEEALPLQDIYSAEKKV